MGKLEEYMERAKSLAEEAGEAAKSAASEVVNKARELTDDGNKVRELAQSAKEQTSAMTLGAREKVQGVLNDARAVKEVKLAVDELKTLPEDGSILYKMDLESIINDMSKLSLFITDSRLDNASVEEEIRKVMEKVQLSDMTAASLTEEQLSDEQLLIQKAKTIAHGACTRALASICGDAE